MKHRANYRLHVLTALAAAALALGTPALQAQNVVAASDTDQEASLSEVIVTGTRTTGLEAAESPAPVQILSPAALEAASGNPDLMQTLAQIVPSLTYNAFGFDMSNQTLQARLKGLSPNHVLVLINGKRRHTTANLAVDAGSVYQGGASTDMNFIPAAAIDHIEVLTEGAAAQYGSDAIAGVINIILKKNSSGGSIGGTYGADYDGGPPGNTVPWSFNGGTTAVTANIGFEPMDGAYLNITGEIHNHAHTMRGQAEARALCDDPGGGLTGPCGKQNNAVYPDSNEPQAWGYPYLNWIQGDAETHSKLASFNAGFDLGGGAEFYAFGTYGTKTASSFQNYREPNIVCYSPTYSALSMAAAAGTNCQSQTDAVYPDPWGFDPQEYDEEIDYAATAGVKGVAAGWNWDFSSTWGDDHHNVYTMQSANPGVYGANLATVEASFGCATTACLPANYPLPGQLTPLNYYDGLMVAQQWTTNFDINHDWDVGMAGPLNTAVGVEYRQDTYTIGAGEPEAYLGGGPSSFAGFDPTDAGTNKRQNEAVYVDLAGKPIAPLLIDLAGRYEHFSDFGSATVGKLTARYDFAPEFAIRGTVSNGFRAPTLAEEYYSSTNVGPSSTDAQLPPNSAAAAVLGLGKLQPEKSTNLTVGFVARPLPNMSATVDFYRIRVDNRIVGSATLNGLVNGAVISPLINEVLTDNGVPINPVDTNTGINLFTNGVNTTTDGVDVAFQFPVQYDFGQIEWSVSGTYNDTAATYIKPTSPALAVALNGSPIYSPQTISDLTTASPKYIINLGAHWTYGKVSINLLEKLYGPSSEYELDDADNAANTDNYYKTTIPFTPITNIDLAYQLTKALGFSVGANNAFNRYPPLENAHLIAEYNSVYGVANNDAAATQVQPIFSPFGIDGGFYYMRATFKF
jgi:iron complex outermembrane receptor protein